MVPVMVELEAPLSRTVSVSVAEVTCCVWAAAASSACRGANGVLADPPLLTDPPPLAGRPPEEQAAARISAAADRPTVAARCRTGRRHRDAADVSCLLEMDVIWPPSPGQVPTSWPSPGLEKTIKS